MKFDFKRTQTEFTGGDVESHNHMIFVPKQMVTIINCVDEDDDQWRVQLSDGRDIIVPGDEMRPHPEERETNEEFIQRLMTWAESGPLIQGFIMEALRIYSEQVVAMPANQREKMDNGFIAYGAWANCAKEVLEELEKLSSARRSTETV